MIILAGGRPVCQHCDVVRPSVQYGKHLGHARFDTNSAPPTNAECKDPCHRTKDYHLGRVPNRLRNFDRLKTQCALALRAANNLKAGLQLPPHLNGPPATPFLTPSNLFLPSLHPLTSRLHLHNARITTMSHTPPCVHMLMVSPAPTPFSFML